MIAKRHVGKVANPCFLTNPRVVAHGKSPWILDSDIWLDDQAASDPCFDPPQQPRLGAVHALVRRGYRTFLTGCG